MSLQMAASVKGLKDDETFWGPISRSSGTVSFKHDKLKASMFERIVLILLKKNSNVVDKDSFVRIIREA